MKRVSTLILSFILLLNLVAGNTVNVFAKENIANELPILDVSPSANAEGVAIDTSVHIDLDSAHKNFNRYKDFIEKGKYTAVLNGNNVDSYFDAELNRVIFYGFSLDLNTDYTVALNFLANAKNNKNDSDMVAEVYSFKTSEEGLPTVRHLDDDGNLYTFTSGQESLIDHLKLKNEKYLKIEELLDPNEKKSMVSSPVSLEFLGATEEAWDEVKVNVKFKEKPYGIVNLHMDEGRAEWLPFFTVDSGNEVEFRVKENVLLVPFVKETKTETSSLLHRLSEVFTGATVSAAENTIDKMFNIIQNSNGVFQAELSYLMDNPFTFEPFGGDPEYYYQIYKIVNKKPVFMYEKELPENLIIHENLDTSVYEIRLFENDPGDYFDDHFWTQELFVEKNPTLLGESEIAALAKKYAPILAYNADEGFFPISFDQLMNSNVPNNATVKTPSVFDSNNEISYNKLNEFLSFNGHSSYLINGGDEVGLNEITGSRENSTVYYSYMERNNRKFINYHFIYAYDPKTIKENKELGRHNFDRESITIELTAANEIKDVVISGHLEGQKMNLIDDDYYWESSRIKIPFSEDIPKYENHPIIPVAQGAHALFPVSGQYLVDDWRVPFWWDVEDQTGLLRDLNEDDFNQLPVNHRDGRNILLPNSSDVNSNDFNHYSLQSLDLAQTSHSNFSVLSFSGYWVDVPGVDNAEFPPFTDKEINVINWVDYADTGWNMNRFVEGSATRESIDDINEFLNRYIQTDSSKVSGLIKNAVTDELVEGADIQGFNENRTPMKNKTTSGSGGLYTLNMPAGDGLNLVISKAGYIPLEYQGLSLRANEEKFLETILQIPSEYENLQNGVLKGNVIQADTGRAVGNADITLRKNFNAKTGNSVANATSSSDGTYLFENLPTGYYTMEVAKSGYTDNYINVVVVGGREVVRQITLSPRLNENEMRIVLEWGASPSDLDSHLIGESTNGGQFHVSYSNTRYYENGQLHAELDLDDTSSYGPETITVQGMKISDNENGTYQYYVHDYTNRYSSGSNALSNSEAKVKVYTASGYTEYTVPQNQAGTKWSVFKMVSGEIVPINTLE